MKTIQQDLKSNNLYLSEAVDVAQNHPLWTLMLHSALRTPSGACQKRRSIESALSGHIEAVRATDHVTNEAKNTQTGLPCETQSSLVH